MSAAIETQARFGPSCLGVVSSKKRRVRILRDLRDGCHEEMITRDRNHGNFSKAAEVAVVKFLVLRKCSFVD
jgi:hypothetical protein